MLAIWSIIAPTFLADSKFAYWIDSRIYTKVRQSLAPGNKIVYRVKKDEISTSTILAHLPYKTKMFA